MKQQIKQYKIKIVLNVLVLFCMLLITNKSIAQFISLQQAIDSALQNNANIAVKQWQEKQAAATIATATDIPKTIINTELGAVNTSNFDSRLNVTQSFALPNLYKAQKSVLEQILKQQQLQTVLQKADIKKLVQLAYGQIQYLQLTQKILYRADSIYSQFQTKAALRFSKGETNLLEKVTLDNLVQQNANDIQQNKTDIQIAYKQLQVLLNTTHPFLIKDTLNVNPLLFDSTVINQHPYLLAIKQQVPIAQQQIQVEKAKLLPDVSIGYSNQSIVGWQTNKDRTETLYNAANRFSIAQLGVFIPIFSKAQKAKIEAAKQQAVVAEKQVNAVEQQFLFQVEKTIYLLQKEQNTYNYYKQYALPQSETIIATATVSYSNGSIGYIEWGTLMNNALSIQLKYTQAQWQLYIANTELAYLFTNSKLP